MFMRSWFINISSKEITFGNVDYGIGIKVLKLLRLTSPFNKQVVSLGSTSTVEGIKTVGYETGEYEMGENMKDSLEKGNG